MYPVDPPSDLTDADFSRLRPAYGFTDALSLSVSYGFTLADLRGMVFSADHPSEVQRTAFHEAVHVNQMLATSYGYYCQLLRDFQAASVIAIVHSIRTTYDTGPRLPIYKQVLGLPREPAAEEARDLLLGWYKAELMLRWFEGDVAALNNLLEHLGPKFDGPMITQFAQVDYWLTHFMQETGRARLPTRDPVIRMEREAQETAKRERHLLMFKFILDYDAAGVLESAARASEFWEQHGPIPDEMHGGAEGIRSEMIRYQGLLREAIEALPTGDTHTFALTYAITTDVVLNAPLLPQHAAVRSPRIELADLDPIARMRTALAAASRLRPVSDLSAAEYERFSGELCAACGWPTPSELARLVLPSAPESRADHITDLYLVSLRMRAVAPHAFVDLSVFYRRGDLLTSTLQHYFSPAIMLFTDTFRLHNDHDLVRSHIDSYLLRTYLRAIMLTSEPRITLPYPADDEEVVFWTRSLREALADVGFANPAIRLVPGRLRIPHTT
jgi:hypothetical protein